MLKVKTDALRAAFRGVDRVLPQTGVMSSLFVQLQSPKPERAELQLSGVGTALERVVTDGDHLPSPIFLERKALGAYLSMAAGEVVSITLSGGNVQLRSGRSKLDIAQPVKVDGYRKWEPSKTGSSITVDPGMIRMLSNYTADSPGFEHMDRVCFLKGVGALATDSFALAAALYPQEHTVDVTSGTAKILGTEELWCEKGGSALRTKTGWYFHPFPNTPTPYPLGEAREAILRVTTSKDVLLTGTIAALHSALKQLHGFAWEGAPQVQCLPDKQGMLLRMVGQNVKCAEVGVDLKAGKNLPEKWGWPLVYTLPWLGHLEKSTDAPLEVGSWEHQRWFRCKLENVTYVLLVAAEQE